MYAFHIFNSPSQTFLFSINNLKTFFDTLRQGKGARRIMLGAGGDEKTAKFLRALEKLEGKLGIKINGNWVELHSD